MKKHHGTLHPRLLVARAEEKHAFADLEPLASLHDSLLRHCTPWCQTSSHTSHDHRLLRLLTICPYGHGLSDTYPLPSL